MVIEQNDNKNNVKRPYETKASRSIHGSTRSHNQNMIEGIHKGYEKHLEIIGVGYRAQKQGNKLVIGAGFSHPVEIEPIEGIEIDVPKNTEIIVKGIDKELVEIGRASCRERV